MIRENIEWCEIRVHDSNIADLNIPRVLLVGDSITAGYSQMVSKLLEEKASLGWLCTSRFPTDPAFEDEVLMVLRHTKFNIVHFNNGLHGFDNSDESYAESLTRVVAKFRAASPGASWRLANSTPVRKPDALGELESRTERVIVRNQVMRALAEKNNFALTDLFSLVESHPEFYDRDGTHFNELGRNAQAKLVAQNLLEGLTSGSFRSS